MLNKTFKWLAPLMASLMILSCGENTPSGPDITDITETDLPFFNRVYKQCNINNSLFDCNCIARVNVEHRASAYAKYASEFDSVHKPQMEANIEKMTTTLAEKTMNRSDERVLEALTEDLHRLQEILDNGVENIDDFKLPFLPAGATDSCKLEG